MIMRISQLCAKNFAAAVLIGALGSPLSAQDTVPVQFGPGATSTVVNGALIGDEYIDYVVGARQGQTMVVSLAVTGTNGNGSAFFNILPAGQDGNALYVGSTDVDSRAEVVLPRDGDYAIRTYLMGNDRDTGRTVGYSLNVSITAASTAPPASSAQTATVTGVASDDVLNVRSGPGTGYAIVGALGLGDTVRRLECEDMDGSRWCEIEMMTDMRERGWVNARYLSEGGVGATQLPSATRSGRVRFEAGTNGTEFTDQLGPGMSVTYQLGARDGQMLYFRLAANGPGLSWRIFTPDGSLLDEATAARDYRGSLFRTGDHRIEVTNTGASAQSFNVIVGIQ